MAHAQYSIKYLLSSLFVFAVVSSYYAHCSETEVFFFLNLHLLGYNIFQNYKLVLVWLPSHCRPALLFVRFCSSAIFTARRSYASAVLGVVSLSVRLSVTRVLCD